MVSGISRRAIASALTAAALIAPRVGAQELKVTLLGTGGPPPVMNRFGPSILVEAGDKSFLFDAGRGALLRLTEIGVQWQDVEGLFLTHLHSDHVVGFADLWLTGWITSRPRRDRPVLVWGPRGTAKMMSRLEEAYEYDIRIRLYDEDAPPDGIVILAEDISEGSVYRSAGVEIAAFEVDHSPIKPAFGYRLDYGGHSVVFSGDTRVSENLIRHARDVDLLVHEVIAPESLERAGIPSDLAKAIVEHHVTPEQAGEIFSRTKPKLAVYSHIIMPAATRDELIAQTRKTYSGPVEVGEDLMEIVIGEEVEVQPSARSSH